MIKNWQSHQEYRHFLHRAKVHFDGSQRTRLTGEFAAAKEKLRLLNLDPVMELLEPYYPPDLLSIFFFRINIHSLFNSFPEYSFC